MSAKKKGAQKGAAATKDPLDDELSALVRSEARAEADAGPLFDEAPAGLPKKGESDLVGKRVRFFDEDEDGKRTPAYGKVFLHDLGTGDLVITPEEDEDAEVEAHVEDVTVVEAGGEQPEEEPIPVAPATPTPRDAVAPEKVDAASYEVFFLPVSSIKLPKVKVRTLDKATDEKYAGMLADAENRLAQGLQPLREPIGVSSREDPVLVEGHTRLEIMKDLERKLVPCRVVKAEGEAAQFVEGFRSNVHRREMDWLDVANGFAYLTSPAGGGWKQKDLAREFGINESEVSRYMAAPGLPPEIKAKVRTGELARATALELTLVHPTIAPKVQERVLKAIEDAGSVGRAAVRRITQEERAVADDEAKAQQLPTIAEQTSGPKPRKPAVFRDLSVKDVGDLLGFRVHPKKLEVTVVLHREGSFEGFDLLEAVREALETTFSNESLGCRSAEDLARALEDARAEVAE